MRKQLFFFSLLTLTACGQNATQSSETKALVSREQADQAFSIVAGIDYVPFTYVADGCYARSLYMSLELAAQGIPSSEHFVTNQVDGLHTGTADWGYHVAPLLQLKDSTQEPWILDPAFETEPLTRTEWINKDFAANDDSSDGLESRAQNTTTQILAGSVYFDNYSRGTKFDSGETNLFTVLRDSSGDAVGLTPKPINKAKLVADFSQLPTFLSEDIHSACTVLHKYIYNEKFAKDGWDNLAIQNAKVTDLVASTTRLVKAMAAAGKLTKSGLAKSSNNIVYKDESVVVRNAKGESKTVKLAHTTDCTNAIAGYYK